MKTRLGQAVVIGVTATLLAAGATAAELNYTFGEIRYVDTELDAGPFDVDGDGFQIGGSLELTDSVHIFANYQTVDFGSGVDVNTFQIGGGYAMPLRRGTDLVARLSYINGEIDFPGGDVDDNGFGFSGGIRNMFTRQFEGRAFINYVDLDESGDEFSIEVAGDWYFSDELVLGASLELGDDVTTWTLGARWYFGGGRR